MQIELLSKKSPQELCQVWVDKPKLKRFHNIHSINLLIDGFSRCWIIWQVYVSIFTK